MTGEMKIGKSVKDIPYAKKGPPRKYAAVYEAVAAAKGEWVPVEMPSVVSAKNLTTASAHNEKFQVSQRGNTVYVRLRPQNGATP